MIRLPGRRGLLAPLAALLTLRPGPAAAQAANGTAPDPAPSGPIPPDPAPSGALTPAVAQDGALTRQAGGWRSTTQGELASAYVNTIPTFRQAAGEAAARTLGEELGERVAFTQFLSGGRSPGEAIALAIDYVWRNNGGRGGEVLLPPGPPITVTASIAARPGVLVRGPRLIQVPPETRNAFAVFSVDGTDDFGLVDLDMALSRRAGPASVTGNASGFSARGLRVREGRSIWFKNARAARISDMICRGGTNAIGAGSDPSDGIEDIVVSNLQAYDMRDEAVDINYNVTGFHLSGFTFRRCALGRRGEVIDIGGGNCRDITIANGLIDCSGAPHRVNGITLKRRARNVKIIGVDIVNGRDDATGIHLNSCSNVAIEATNVDASFLMGVFSQSEVSDVRWRGGRCDSPIAVAGGADIEFDLTHDGGGTTSPRPAFSIGGDARRITMRGTVRNRPQGAAVVIGTGRSTPADCSIDGMRVQKVARGVLLHPGCDAARILDLQAREVGGDVVRVGAGCRHFTLRNLSATDYATDQPGTGAALRLGPACHGSILRDVVARDTRAGDARSSGPAILIEGPSEGVILDGVLASNLAGPAQQGLDHLSGSTAGRVLTLAEPAPAAPTPPAPPPGSRPPPPPPR